MNIHEWARNLLNGRPAPEPEPTPVIWGRVRVGDHWELTQPDAPGKGIVLVNVTPALVEEYAHALTRWSAVQLKLGLLPVTYRPRRRPTVV